MSMEPTADEKLASLKTLNHVTYALYALSLLGFGTTAIVAIVLNYISATMLEHLAGKPHQLADPHLLVERGMGRGGLYHHDHIDRLVIWGVATIWFIYRIAKGWLNLNEGKPMPLPA